MDEDTPRNQWVVKYPAQVVLGINMIRWTRGAEEAFSKIKKDGNSMSDYAERLQDELKGIVELVRTDL
jgi:dynein heavy chain